MSTDNRTPSSELSGLERLIRDLAEHEVPTVEAREGEGDAVAIVCPYCDGVHIHGASEDLLEPFTRSHRVAHCGDRDAPRSERAKGYFLAKAVENLLGIEVRWWEQSTTLSTVNLGMGVPGEVPEGADTPPGLLEVEDHVGALISFHLDVADE